MISSAAAPLARFVLSAAAAAGLVKALEGQRGASAARRLAVSATKTGIRLARAAEVGAERTRLAAGDIRAQAYGELGEQAPVPTTPVARHDHEH